MVSVVIPPLASTKTCGNFSLKAAASCFNRVGSKLSNITIYNIVGACGEKNYETRDTGKLFVAIGHTFYLHPLQLMLPHIVWI